MVGYVCVALNQLGLGIASVSEQPITTLYGLMTTNSMYAADSPSTTYANMLIPLQTIQNCNAISNRKLIHCLPESLITSSLTLSSLLVWVRVSFITWVWAVQSEPERELISSSLELGLSLHCLSLWGCYVMKERLKPEDSKKSSIFFQFNFQFSIGSLSGSDCIG